MIKFGYTMMAAHMALAGAFWLFPLGDPEDRRFHVSLFMAGAMLWIVGILVWYKVAEQEEQ